MSSDITLSAGVRQNLLSLQNTASLMAQTQNRLATGKKVNSALDNPVNFFTSQSLSANANDLSGLLDAMGNGIQTIQAANNGITAITKLVQSLQSAVTQARSDASAGAVTPGTASTAAANNAAGANNKITFDLGGGTTVDVDAGTTSSATATTLTGTGTPDFTADIHTSTLTIQSGTGTAVTIDISGLTGAGGQDEQDVLDAINASLTNASSTISAVDDGGQIKLTNSNGEDITVGGTAASGLGFGTGNTTSTNGTPGTFSASSLSDLKDAINNTAALSGKVKADIDGTGKLTLQNLTTTAISVAGFDGTNITGDSGDSSSLAAGTAGLSTVRQNQLNQFNNLLTQINQTASDSGYSGINLLNGDDLKLKFNANGTSSIDVKMTDSTGATFSITAASLSINTATATQFGDNTALDTLSDTLNTALTTLRSQASSLGSQLSIVQTRQDFTKSMINTLQTGSDNLVLADTNEEGANMLALQTRQSLSTTALSLASQADQNVLRLFG
jgi:flagellin-like hook-associated protein FlgL